LFGYRRRRAIEKNGVGDTDGLLAAERLDRNVQGDAQPRCRRADARNRKAPAHARTRTERCEKTHAVEPVIQHRSDLANLARAVPERRNEREQEVAVRDGASVGALRGAERIDVNPLAVVGAGGERVDPSLVDAQPWRREEFAPFERAEAGKTVHDFRCHFAISLRRRSHDAPVDYRTFSH